MVEEGEFHAVASATAALIIEWVGGDCFVEDGEGGDGVCVGGVVVEGEVLVGESGDCVGVELGEEVEVEGRRVGGAVTVGVEGGWELDVG